MTRDEIVAGAFQSIQAGSKSFRAASRLFDRTTRERAWMLYAWCRYCDDVADGQLFGQAGSRGDGSTLAQIEGLTARAVAGEPTGVLPFEGLRQLLSERPIPRRFLDDHLQGFKLDEQGWSPATEDDLIRYCYHVAGAVGCMMAIVMDVDPDDETTLERASDLGIAFQLSNIARDIREDAAAGRCYLPAQWLQGEGLTRETLLDPARRDGLVRLAARLVALAERYEDRSREGVGRLPFRARLAVLAATRIYGGIGRRVERLGAKAWDERVTVGKAEKLAYLVPSFAEALMAGRRG